MDSSEDDKERQEKRQPDRGKRKSSRKRKRKGKSKSHVSSDEDNMETRKVDSKVSDNQTSINAMLLIKDEQAATLPRDRRSRSTSGKRSLKDLFRRTPATDTKRSQSAERQISSPEDEQFHDALEALSPDNVVTDEITDYTKYNPTLQPRNRLRYMTVLDAVREKQARRSPGRTLSSLEKQILNDRMNLRSSSLPDISATESNEDIEVLRKNKTTKRRSKSADMPRRPKSAKSNAANNAMSNEAAIASEEIASLETHFPCSSSHPNYTGVNSSPIKHSLKLDLQNQHISDSADRHSFVESESNRRESFNRFLQLRNNLPPFSSSSIARARNYDSSPNEGNFNILEYIAEQSRLENETILKEVDTKVEDPRTYVRCPSYEEVIKEKIALQKSLQKQMPSDVNKTHSSMSPGQSTRKPVRESDKEDASLRGETNKRQEGDTEVLGSKQEVTEREGRTRKRGVYKSPRRFTGRRSSIENKSKERKDFELDSERKAERIEHGKRKISLETETTGKSSNEKVNETENYSKNISPLTSYIPRNKKEDSTAVSHKYKRSFSPRGEINDKIRLEKPDSKVVSFKSQSVQTADVSKKEFRSIAINTDIDFTYDFVKSVKQIPVIVESVQDSNNDIDIETLQRAEIPRKFSARSVVSDKSADIGSDEENLLFKTPEASPVFQRKQLTSVFGIDKETLEKSLENQKAEDDKIKNDKLDKNKGKDGNKPKGKLSIMSIVALKRRLAKQRKQKNETVVSHQESEELPTKDDENTQENQDFKNKNRVFIENETTINLNKINEMNETDIVDDVVISDETIFPKKHISFEKGDEPITSDEPLEDDLLRNQRQRLKTRRESRMIQKRREVISCCKKFVAFLFSHIGLCSLMVAYSICGGFIFQALESPFEEDTRINVRNVRRDVSNNIVELAFEVKLNKRNRNNLTSEVNALLTRFQTEVYTATDLYGWNNEDDNMKAEKQWSFASSLLFAITVMTTIGYGHVAPKTDSGRIVTIAYAVLGIPLTLLCLTNIGDLMATGFRMLYAKVCCGVCCILFSPQRRRIPDPEKGLDQQDLVIQREEKSPEVIHVPTSLCILLMTSYILLGTLLFSIWEGWDAITGTYFSFITLSTIGFGDVVPGTAMDQWASEEKLVLCAMYLVFGLSLIAMCFNLVQEDVKAKCRWLGAKIGIFDSKSH